MKFPDRPNGASGGLVRANQFDQSPTAPFSRTRQGANTIHKRNGDLLITRDVPVSAVPPYLLSNWPDGGFTPNNPLATMGVQRRFGLDDEERSDDPLPRVAASALPAKSASGRQFVGDGFMVQVYPDAAGRRELVLVPIDDPTRPIRLGVYFDLLGPEATFGVSFAPMGFKDAVHRYAFAVFTVAVVDDQLRYVCHLGSTGTKSVYRTVALPELPDSPYESTPTSEDYRVQWWHNQLGMTGFWQDKGFAKMYGVGRGQLLTVLVGQERIERTDGTWGITPPYLPDGAAPYLLRSDDFGDTWRMEKADFLAQAMPSVAADVGGPLVQSFAWYSQTFACPLGDGRIALVAAGASLSEPLEGEADGTFGLHYHSQTLRLFISDTAGRDFRNRPWPLDSARNEWPFTIGASVAGTHTLTRPLLGSGMGYTQPNVSGVGTLGPGTLYAVTLAETCTNPGNQWGSYPRDYPVVVHISRNGGLSWEAERIDPQALPLAQSFAALKAAWGQSPIHTGNGTYAADNWALHWLDLAVLEPVNALGQGGHVAFVSPEFTGPLALATTAGPRSFADLRRTENLEPEGYAYASHPELVVGLPNVTYTGDDDNDEHPEAVYLGFPEFEARP